MATQTDVRPKPRAHLSRERVLSAALILADRGGIESLTMRRLGQELRVEAMSLYNHVANKEDIIDGIVDLVFGEIALPADRGDWKTAMRKRAISAHEALLRHPWATSLMQSRTKPGLATLRHHDSVLGSLRQAGFTLVMAAHESAGADEALREAVMQGERAFARDMALIAQALQAHGALHPDLSVEEATDILLLLVSPQAHQVLRRDRKRSVARYRSTVLKALERSLGSQLLIRDVRHVVPTETGDGKLEPRQISLGKLNNARESIAIARECRTILGANGITLDYSVLRHANNLESVLTYEGTSEMHTLVIGQALTGLSAFT